MNIDIQSIREALAAVGTAVRILRQAKDLLPEGSEKEQVDEAIQTAERQLKVAEAQAAQGMRYELCRNHFPPEVMLSEDNTHWRCPNCGNTRETQWVSLL